jgi:hypothetical protein
VVEQAYCEHDCNVMCELEPAGKAAEDARDTVRAWRAETFRYSSCNWQLDAGERFFTYVSARAACDGERRCLILDEGELILGFLDPGPLVTGPTLAR